MTELNLLSYISYIRVDIFSEIVWTSIIIFTIK